MEELNSDILYDKLHHLQVGRIGEYWVKLMLTMQGLDTYYSDVDNKAIDFVVRLDNSKHIDIQVKTVCKSSYIFINKNSWSDEEIKRDNLYLAVVLLRNHNYPKAYLIPSTAWLAPDSLLKNMQYQSRGKKSVDEWGINLSKKNLPLLQRYDIVTQANQLKKS